MGKLAGKFATPDGYVSSEVEYDFAVPVSEWMEKQDEWANYTLRYVEMENLFDLEKDFYSSFGKLRIEEGHIYGTVSRMNTGLIAPDAIVYVQVLPSAIRTLAELMLRKDGG